MSQDINVTVEEILEKLKSQGAFDSKRKVFLSEITNKSTFQNLHTKVENLTTKFLENVRWPPTIEKHNLREQLRLHIQSTDQFNDYIDRLVNQEINSKIESDLLPLIEEKACEYLEVDYEQWKINIQSQTFNKETSPNENNENDLEIEDTSKSQPVVIKTEKNIQSANVSSSEFISTHNNSTTNMAHIITNLTNSLNTTSFMISNAIPNISLLPPPHSIHPSAPFPCLPPPPLFINFDKYPPPPPPEMMKPPSPPPIEAGPNTPTEEYIPEFPEIQSTIKEKETIMLSVTPVKDNEDNKIKIVRWQDVEMILSNISDASKSDSEIDDRPLTNKIDDYQKNLHTGDQKWSRSTDSRRPQRHSPSREAQSRGALDRQVQSRGAKSRWPHHSEGSVESRNDSEYRPANRSMREPGHTRHAPLQRGPRAERGEPYSASSQQKTASRRLHSRSGSRSGSDVSWRTVEGRSGSGKIRPPRRSRREEPPAVSFQRRKSQVRARLREIAMRTGGRREEASSEDSESSSTDSSSSGSSGSSR